MSIALAIETSSRTGSIALADISAPQLCILAEEQFAHGLKHAAEIIPIIDRLCGGRGLGPADVAELHVSAGPGSFTGLRIAITLAKILAFARGTKLVAVPTVRVLAENAPPETEHLVIVLDAKRDQIYTARFAREMDEWREVEGAHLDTLAAVLARSPRPVWLLGEGIPAHEPFIPDDPGIIVAPADTWRPRAAVAAMLGARMARLGQYTDPYHLVPIYIRPPEAEEKWQAMHGASPCPQ